VNVVRIRAHFSISCGVSLAAGQKDSLPVLCARLLAYTASWMGLTQPKVMRMSIDAALPCLRPCTSLLRVHQSPQ
jgi:hypothetical protein